MHKYSAVVLRALSKDDYGPDQYLIVVAAALAGGLTPGPGTLAISGTAMAQGRAMGLAVAWGITTGSTLWAIAAGLGVGSLLAANQWLADALRYAGAAHLAWLAWNAARAALRRGERPTPRDISGGSLALAWIKGLLIHLGNPKAVVFWGSILAIGTKPGAGSGGVLGILAICLVINVAITTSYALLFSSEAITHGYLRMRRWLEGLFAAVFGVAAIYLFASRDT
ncbi:MAG: LysE family translocator [Pseudomonadota bacterium]